MREMTQFSKYLFVASVLSLFALNPRAMADEASGGAGDNKDSGSEFFYQTASGRHAVSASLQYITTKVNFAFGGNISSTTTILELQYEYGVNDLFSAGGTVGYSNATNMITGFSNTTSAGIENIDAFIKGTVPAGIGDFKYGADLSISPSNHTVDSSGNSNAATGGQSVMPYLGYQMSAGPGVFGAKILTQFDLGSRTTTQSGLLNITSTGNDVTEFEVFYELHLVPVALFGAEIAYLSYSDTTNTPGGNSQNVSPFVGVSVYGSLLTGAGEFLPQIGYLSSNDNSINGNPIASADAWSIQLIYRLTL